MTGRKNSQKILALLEKEYPDIKGTALMYNNTLELLVATILSAQCTDERVNDVTRILFNKYRTANDYARADLEDLEEIIKPTGFYHRKAKFIKEVAEKLIEDFSSEIPQSIEKLTELPGVARKTANVVLSNAFHVDQGIAVDTHVMRLSKRLGFTEEQNREKIEKDLMDLFPRDEWFEVSNLLIAHGRNVCTARKPKCEECIVNEICPSAFSFDR
ncbi:MAG: endonuclease III [Candidatus Bathyarchaeota archaeon]|jgi:endonuclease-3